MLLPPETRESPFGLALAKSGSKFTAVIEGACSIEELRAQAKAETGMDIHIHAVVGPSTSSECPAIAIDDEHINPIYRFYRPAEGLTAVFGHFHE